MKILAYTVYGYLPYDTRELMAGDQVDIPITAQVVGAPDKIRALVQSVEETTVSGVEGRIYQIEYDETLLGANLNELDQCCNIGLPTAVTCCMRVDEILTVDFAEFLAANPFKLSENSNTDFSKTLIFRSEERTINPASAQSIYVQVADFVAELGVITTAGQRFKMKLETVVTSSNPANNTDYYADHTYIGRLGGGSTLIQNHKTVSAPDTITVARVGEGVQVSVENNSDTETLAFFVEAKFTLLHS